MALTRRAFLSLAAAIPAFGRDLTPLMPKAAVTGPLPATYNSAVFDTAVFG